jgi:hypothetical protein
MTDVTLEDLRVISRWSEKIVRLATHADILAVVKQMGGMEAHAVPVLPGGPPLWVNAGGPGRYLIIPIEEDLMPDGRPWPDEGERKFEKT